MKRRISGRKAKSGPLMPNIGDGATVIAEKTVVYADKEVTDLLDLLIEYWKLTEGCDCTALMTNKEETHYLQIKDKLEMEDM